MKKFVIIIASIILIFTLIMGITLVSVGAYFNSEIDYETDDRLFLQSGQSSSVSYLFYDENGNLKEMKRKFDGEKRTRYSFDEISDYLKICFLSAEDRKFYKHHGVDIKRTAGAFFNYLFHFKPTFGASTITQQVVKNISGDNDLTARRKITEIMRAIHLELTHSKDEIFELYLNIVPMTDNVLGVGEASNLYFGKEPYELSLEESATLVGITNSPNRYNPYKNLDSCKEKRNHVLYSLVDSGYIKEEEYNEIKEKPLVLKDSSEVCGDCVSSWFSECATEDIISDLMTEYKIKKGAAKMMLFNGNKIVLTMNEKVQSILDNYFENVENFPIEAQNGLKYSMAVVDNKSGNLLGIVGNVGKNRDSGYLNYATVPLTVGSCIKPLSVYAPLFDRHMLTWSTLVCDEPFSYIERNGEKIPYPKNSPDRYDGDITVKDAIRLSKNTVAMKLCQVIGLENVFSHLKNDYGFKTLVEKRELQNGKTLTDIGYSPLALGQLSDGISLRKLTESYTVFPNEGVLKQGKSYFEVIDAQGKTILSNKGEERRLYSNVPIRIMNRLLMSVTDSGTARSITLKNIVDTGGKTGTSGGDRDRLFVGFTPYVTAGIWCGYGNNEKAVGKRSPSHLEIWDRVMKEIHEKVFLKSYEESVKSFSSEGLVLLPYCKKSGKLPSDNCLENIEYGYFDAKYAPSEECDNCENGEPFEESEGEEFDFDSETPIFAP